MRNDGTMSLELPVAVRASALSGIRRFTKRRFRYFNYALRYRDGREVSDLGSIEFGKLLQGHRYPADTHCVRNGAERHCPERGDGVWVDYPYGNPLPS
ncbi:hypothetical protein CQ015_17615 [Arthrobacter sp. MYb221]|nr:hypothetical protein CQ015_17615 [Arthrobacter sp. MYb221]